MRLVAYWQSRDRVTDPAQPFALCQHVQRAVEYFSGVQDMPCA